MFLTIVIFVIILGILVFVHEFGHFIVAKKSGMQVDEFGFGFPPRIVGLQKIDGKLKWVWGNKKQNHPDETYAIPATTYNPATLHQFSARPKGDNLLSNSTIYSINLIPLGGFVRILGENNEHENDPRSFINRPFWGRFFTLVAGVLMNVLLAWVLLSAANFNGITATSMESINDVPKGATVSNPRIDIFEVLPDRPAAKAGIEAEDVLLSLDGRQFSNVPEVQAYINSHAGQPVNFEVLRIKQKLNFSITPNLNPAPDEGRTGIALSLIGNIKYPWYSAIWEGGKDTGRVIGLIFTNLGQLFTGRQGFSSVGGPVKIAKYVGIARQYGFGALLNLTTVLSLSLAALNILPFPALDGGRVLFLLIEKVRGKRNNQKVEQIVNTAGFVFLLLLMVVVTINDLVKK